MSEEHKPSSEPVESPAAQLSSLFGSYKAEWLRENLFELYLEPSYWPEITTNRPCIIEGGRGTGKTTVLRALSYEGQYALNGRRPTALESMSFVGFYSRVDTNRVRAFTGDEIEERQWVRVFSHYLNLVLVAQVLEFDRWQIRHTSGQTLLDEETSEFLFDSLNLDENDSSDIVYAVRRAITKLESAVNNIGDGLPQGLSMARSPVDRLMERLKTALPGKEFFFLMDEYENFDDYQQQVVNTFIKHAGETYTFKIGVRELGFRTRSTLNPDEQLISPSDYMKIDVAQKLSAENFRAFATDVCNSRLKRLGQPGARPDVSIHQLLPGLTEDEEAELLGVEAVVERELADLHLTPSSLPTEFAEAKPLDKYLVLKWAEKEGTNPLDEIRSFVTDSKRWSDRRTNYGYALLFTIRRGRRGTRGIQKYYAGWETFTTLAAGNIRYALELVHQAILHHFEDSGIAFDPISVTVQTRAAQQVGRKNLSELEGISVHGARLTRLVLGLGRVFEIFALDPIGHTPEIVSFKLGDPGLDQTDESDYVEGLLRSAVMHLALLRDPGNKLTSHSDTRDYEYRLHPIFSPFFVFSHRKKRNMTIPDNDLAGLVKSPRSALQRILERNNRSAEDELPEQLELFGAYYRSDA